MHLAEYPEHVYAGDGVRGRAAAAGVRRFSAADTRHHVRGRPRSTWILQHVYRYVAPKVLTSIERSQGRKNQYVKHAFAITRALYRSVDIVWEALVFIVTLWLVARPLLRNPVVSFVNFATELKSLNFDQTQIFILLIILFDAS